MKVLTILTKIYKKVHGFFRSHYYVNTVDFQKNQWEKTVAQYDWSEPVIYGNHWGNPDDPKDRLGNYLWVKQQLQSYAVQDKTILEIGSLTGKWTQYLLTSGKIICVDLNPVGFDYIKQKLPSQNIQFYLTNGNELKDIPSLSVDLVFSLDTFVRVPKKHIFSYFDESYRVLKNNGEIFLHLPCTSKKICNDMNFVRISKSEILTQAKKTGFIAIHLVDNILNHGVILRAKKSCCKILNIITSLLMPELADLPIVVVV